MVWFVKVSCPFLKVEYENEYKSHPICRLNGVYLDVHDEYKKEGCTGCKMLELTPTKRWLKFKQKFPVEYDKTHKRRKKEIEFEEQQTRFLEGI